MAVHHHKTLFQAMNLLESTNHYHIQSSIARHLSLPLQVQGVHKIYSQFKTHILQRQLMRYFRLVLLASVVFVYFCVSGTRLSEGLELDYFLISRSGVKSVLSFKIRHLAKALCVVGVYINYITFISIILLIEN